MKLPSGRRLWMPGLCMVGMCPCHLLRKLKLVLRSQRNKTENSLLSLNKNIHILYNCDNDISVTQSHGVCSHPSQPPPGRRPAQVLQVVPTALSTLEAKSMEPLGPGRPPQAKSGPQASQWSSTYHYSLPWRPLIQCDTCWNRSHQ